MLNPQQFNEILQKYEQQIGTSNKYCFEQLYKFYGFNQTGKNPLHFTSLIIDEPNRFKDDQKLLNKYNPQTIKNKIHGLIKVIEIVPEVQQYLGDKVSEVVEELKKYRQHFVNMEKNNEQNTSTKNTKNTKNTKTTMNKTKKTENINKTQQSEKDEDKSISNKEEETNTDSDLEYDSENEGKIGMDDHIVQGLINRAKMHSNNEEDDDYDNDIEDGDDGDDVSSSQHITKTNTINNNQGFKKTQTHQPCQKYLKSQSQEKEREILRLIRPYLKSMKQFNHKPINALIDSLEDELYDFMISH